MKLEATAEGTYIDTENLPAFNLVLNVKDGLIQYPDLPESIEDIQIDVKVDNPGGAMDLTVTDVNMFHFKLGDNPFDASMWIGTPISNATYKGSMKGVIDLASLSQAVPMDSMELRGIISADMQINGDYEMVEKELYEEIEANGRCEHSDFHIYNHDDTEMNRVDTKLDCNWKKDRCHDKQNCGRLHEIAGYQQQDIYDNEEHPPGKTKIDYNLSNMVRNSFSGEYVGEKHCIGNDKEQHDAHLGSIENNLVHLFIINTFRERNNNAGNISKQHRTN